MQTIEQTVSASGKMIVPGGKQFHLLECTAEVDITFYGANNKPLETATGMLPPFRNTIDCIRVEISSVSAQTIKVGVTSGDAEYKRTAGEVSTTFTAPTLTSKSPVALSLSTLTLISAANADKKSVHVIFEASDSLTTHKCFIGDSGVSSGSGLFLKHGDVYLLDTSSAVYAYCSTQTGTIYVNELGN